jgi:hypothetical protein
MTSTTSPHTNSRPLALGAIGLVVLALAAAGVVAAATGWLGRGLDLLAGAVVIGIVGVAVVPIRPPGIDITAVEGGLTVRFRGFNALRAWRRSISIPADEVRQVRTAPLDGLLADVPGLPPRRGWRGTAIGALRVGTCGGEVWNVHDDTDVLLVDTLPGARYRRLVLQVPDPSRTAATLRSALDLR